MHRNKSVVQPPLLCLFNCVCVCVYMCVCMCVCIHVIHAHGINHRVESKVDEVPTEDPSHLAREGQQKEPLSSNNQSPD